jgi:hypothetical protein
VNQGSRIQILAINALLFALLFGLVSLNKAILRPALSQVPILDIITGCFPNFIAACIMGLASVTAVLVRKPVHGRLIVYASCLLVFTALTVEELRPMWGASTYYDGFDILASGLGAVLALAVYEVIDLRRRHRTQEVGNR